MNSTTMPSLYVVRNLILMQSFPISKRYVQGPDFIELTQEHQKEQLAFAESNHVEGFLISHELRNSPFPNLAFLSADIVRGLHVAFESIEDISAINTFHKLEVFTTGYSSYPRQEIRFENFPKMRVLDIFWNKYYKSVAEAKTTVRFNSWGYKPKARDLSALTGWNRLAYAKFTQPGIDCLDGIENLERLKELDLGNVRSLKRFFSNERAAKFPLEQLTISICPNFDIDSIPPIESLKLLGFSKVGKQQTLKHLLAKFPNLETLGFTQSELIDGDLTYLLEHPTLKKVIIDYKKHYSMKEKELQRRLDEKNKVAAG